MAGIDTTTHDGLIRTVIRFFAPDGEPLPSVEGAATCVVERYVGEALLERVYADVNGDASGTGDETAWYPENEDQAKTTWDIWVETPQGYKLAETLEELRTALGWLDLRTQLPHFLELPAWDVAPPRLKREAYTWLRGAFAAPTAEDRFVEEKRLELKRSQLRDDAERRLRGYERQIEELLLGFYERQMEVVLARLRGTKVRRGTRHWKVVGEPISTKALDADQVIQPARWASEIATDAERVVVRVFQRAAEDVVPESTLDVTNPLIEAAVRERIRRIIGTTEARAEELRRVIMDAEAGGDDLDAIYDKVKGTYDQRQIWAATAARTETTGMVNGASLFGAMQAGVLTKEWLSSRDDRVRHTHSSVGGGDGQTAPIAMPFLIGGFPLMFPGDPVGPPQETINCRCSMLFGEPGEADAPSPPEAQYAGTGAPDSGYVEYLGAAAEALGGSAAAAAVADDTPALERLVELLQRHSYFAALGEAQLAADTRGEIADLLTAHGVDAAEVAATIAALEASVA